MMTSVAGARRPLGEQGCAAVRRAASIAAGHEPPAAMPHDARPRSWYDLCAVELPASSGGGWVVEKVDVTPEEEQKSRIRAAASRDLRRVVTAGRYTRLWRVLPDRVARARARGFEERLEDCAELWMSDTPSERRDCCELFARAAGHVLVHGLGLGMLVRPLLSMPKVERLTVVEIDGGLVDLVAPYYAERWGDRFEVVCGDALTWTPPRGARYGAVWHDIWKTISPANLPEMHRLHRRFGRLCAWQGSWARWECERMK
jgi:hypothetical protein